MNTPAENLSTLSLDRDLIDSGRLHNYRLTRIQLELQRLDLAGLLTFDPVNTRYATGMRNMQVWAFHSLIRVGFIPAHGKAVIFEYAGSEHLAAGLDTICEVVSATPLHFGPGHTEEQVGRKLKAFVGQIETVCQKLCGNDRRIAVDNQVPYQVGHALVKSGFDLHSGYRILALAQSVKNEDEIRAMYRSIEVAEIGMQRLESQIRAGMTENQLWAILNHANIELDGEYMDTRLLSSGPRTNPWYQESSDRIVQPGDLIALDTDMVGPYGYDADVSRTFICEPDRVNRQQQDLYRLAYDHVHHNLDLLKPGRGFKELSKLAFDVPEPYRAQSIAMNWHGVSLYGGWPTILGRDCFDENSEDGEVVPGMTLCVEAYAGAPAGQHGVKLEEQVLITETGYRLLSSYPFDRVLLRPC